MEDLRGKEANDNILPKVGDFVSIANESIRAGARSHFHNNGGPYVVAKIHPQGMYIVKKEDYLKFVANPEISDFHRNVMEHGFRYYFLDPSVLMIVPKKEIS